MPGLVSWNEHNQPVRQEGDFMTELPIPVINSKTKLPVAIGFRGIKQNRKDIIRAVRMRLNYKSMPVFSHTDMKKNNHPENSLPLASSTKQNKISFHSLIKF